MKSLLSVLVAVIITGCDGATAPRSVRSTVDDSRVPAELRAAYFEDASRLALRDLLANGFTEISIPGEVVRPYYDALVLVYNANAIPARDTVVDIYRMHTIGPTTRSLMLHPRATGAAQHQSPRATVQRDYGGQVRRAERRCGRRKRYCRIGRGFTRATPLQRGLRRLSRGLHRTALLSFRHPRRRHRRLPRRDWLTATQARPTLKQNRARVTTGPVLRFGTAIARNSRVGPVSAYQQPHDGRDSRLPSPRRTRTATRAPACRSRCTPARPSPDGSRGGCPS